MGNSCHRCFGIQNKNNKYIRSDLSESRDFSIEFENLMTNDYYDDIGLGSKKENGEPFTVSSYMKWLSDQERSFMEDDDDDQKELVGKSNTRNGQSRHLPDVLSTSKRLPFQWIQEKQKQYSDNNIRNGTAENRSNGRYGEVEPVEDRQLNSHPIEWQTFGEEHSPTPGQLNGEFDNERITGYFLDELSRDLSITRELLDSYDPSSSHTISAADSMGYPVTFQEEEIDGPELARLIRRMRPRDLILSGAGRDFLFSGHKVNLTKNFLQQQQPQQKLSQQQPQPSSLTTEAIAGATHFPSGTEASNTSSMKYLDRDTSTLTALYTKIHQNLMKGIREAKSGTTSERDYQSSIDLDWDHEPGMNPSLALEHKRTDTEEDLIKKLNSEDAKLTQPLFTSTSVCCKTKTKEPSVSRTVPSTNCSLPTDPSLTIQVDDDGGGGDGGVECCKRDESQTERVKSPPSHIPLNSPLSSCVDEMAWDMEEEIYPLTNNNMVDKSNDNNNNNNDININNNTDNSNNNTSKSHSSILTSDKCHLLSS